MRGTTIRKLAVVVVLAGLLGGLFATSATAGTYGGRFRERGQLLKVTNASRVYRDLRRVDLQQELSDLARKHSKRMAEAGYIFHTKSPVSYYLRGRSWSWWGENVGVTSGSVRDVHKAFMRSDGHRRNILNRAFRKVAIGTYRSDGLLYVTEFFYRP
ncbi:MAG TPA: CAP domain-containing protein [Actinomycetota bacterium]|nr:CAP domain-containing protein [Actinomycetota bacterium]